MYVCMYITYCYMTFMFDITASGMNAVANTVYIHLYIYIKANSLHFR